MKTFSSALERALEDEGYDTAVTVSGEVAFQILSTGAFDLLVLDDYLSDQHCIQVLTHFRSAGIKPIVVVTYHQLPISLRAQTVARSGSEHIRGQTGSHRTGTNRPLPAAAPGEPQPSIRHDFSKIKGMRSAGNAELGLGPLDVCYQGQLPESLSFVDCYVVEYFRDGHNKHAFFAIQTHLSGV